MAVEPSFALNHMCAPGLDFRAFFDLAVEVGAGAVEIRNDLSGQAILDGTHPSDIKTAAAERRLRILSINAIQRFNEWTAKREREAKDLAAYARDCGAQALVLVPVNDGSGKGESERRTNLETSLAALRPILSDAGIIGLVEPLGFEECSLRSKREAVEAIRTLGAGSAFRLVHDSFHHHLAGEPDLFPAETGLVHISGVVDPRLPVGSMRDAHRVLVDGRDRLGNISQIKALIDAGYRGPLSFEPFADSVHASADIAADLTESIGVIRAGLSRIAA